jgi:hypothetical protein
MEFLWQRQLHSPIRGPLGHELLSRLPRRLIESTYRCFASLSEGGITGGQGWPVSLTQHGRRAKQHPKISLASMLRRMMFVNLLSLT